MNDLISREQLINKLNSTRTNITFDIPVEEILGENVDLDKFAALMQDAIQAYRKMVIDTIEDMHAIYDIDKVVNQLEMSKKTAFDLVKLPHFFIKNLQKLVDICFDRAIEIVKAGDEQLEK